MEFTTDPGTDKWEKYFTTESDKVEKYETLYCLENDDPKKPYNLTLRVSSLKCGNYYAWELITDQMLIIEGHPFERIDKDEIYLYKKTKTTIYIGGLNAKNKVMDSLFGMIMMNEEELRENCGSVDPNFYRSHLVEILNSLWD